MEADRDLQTKADAVSDAVQTLASARNGNDLVPLLGNRVDTRDGLQDLAADWYHLDEFVGDVGLGFARVNNANWNGDINTLPNQVIEAQDRTLAELGQVGYADRDEAIEAANEMADELQQLVDEGASRGDIQRFLNMADRGLYDPAFAVTFSEAIDVSGYTDAVTMIRKTYSDDAPAGVTGIETLGIILTTALSTQAGDNDVVGGFDESTADLAEDEKLDQEFTRDLVNWWPEGVESEDGVAVEQLDANEPFAQDLSLLLRYTDPPADIAADIANSRMTGLLAHQLEAEGPLDRREWAEYTDPVNNYATMLGRNPDASALWLNTELDPSKITAELPDGVSHNIDLVLQVGEDGPMGSGRDEQLANVVEVALTDSDVRDYDLADPPGSLAFGPENAPPTPLVREVLMERAIDVTADLGEIRNPYMYDSLASGVDANFDVIEDRLIDGWEPENGDQPTEGAENTHAFFRELMGNEDAAGSVWATVEDYAIEEIRSAPSDGDTRVEHLRDVGTIEGVIAQAESNALEGSVEERLARQQRLADFANFMVGPYEYVGEVNDLAQLEDRGIGDILYPTDFSELSEAKQESQSLSTDREIHNAVLLAVAKHPEMDISPLRDMTSEQREQFLDWAAREDVHGEQDRESLAANFYRVLLQFQGDT